MNRQPNNTNNGNTSWWSLGATGLAAAGVAAAGVAALAGGLHYLSGTGPHPQNQENRVNQVQSNNQGHQGDPDPLTQTVKKRSKQVDNSHSVVTPSGSSRVGAIMDVLEAFGSLSTSGPQVPAVPKITNLNSLIDDIHVRFIALKREEFNRYYSVFMDVFMQIQNKMKEVDPYYNKYSSRKQFAGSHYDGLRIKKPDEFDMDIVIGLPLNFKENRENNGDSDIVIETKDPGFVQLKMGKQFQTLYKRDGAEVLINKIAYEWTDERGYLLRSKFIDWFKSVIIRALNTFERESDQKRKVYVKGVPYTVRLSQSGPAITMFIEDRMGFKLDVDFVPALKFPEQRWPVSRMYRKIPAGCNREDFMVVPKPNKSALVSIDQSRSWRIALHDQEKLLMKDLNHLKMAIKLMKKLRDSQQMKKIASYYIKTLFFLEIVDKNDATFWKTRSPLEIFKHMVKKLHEALVAGTIPYFWNKDNNLLYGVDKGILKGYAAKVADFQKCMEGNDKKMVAKYLLNAEEFRDYSKFLN